CSRRDAPRMSLGQALGAPREEATGVGPIRVDASAWPRVVVTWPGGVRSDHEVAECLRALALLSRQREAHGVVIDARDARALTPAQLGMVIDLTRRAGPEARCVVHALVTRSPAVRAMADSVRWLHLTPARWAHFEDL